MNLNQITIPSNDVAKAVAFYQTLGLRLIVDGIPRYARLLCPDGESTFSVHHSEQKIQADNGIWVYFECKDLDQRCRELKSLGVTFLEAPEDRTWLWREARLKDPDGHLIILFYAGENRINPPWRVN
ncbi:MAG: VOC family protein [Cyclobacteriaceae bacterium]